MSTGQKCILIVIIGTGLITAELWFLFAPIKMELASNVQSPKTGAIKSAATRQKSTPVLQTDDVSLKLPILMYHHVGSLPQNADATTKDLTVPAQNFLQQVKWLSDNGYHSVSLEDIYLYTHGQFQMPSKPVIFSFDDGYTDVFQNAVPVLKQYGYSGSF